MKEEEIFEKLKEALDYKYLFHYLEDREITNLEDYIENIKICRELEKIPNENLADELEANSEFIEYLNQQAIGDIRPLIECVDNFYVKFEGYKQVTKEIVNGELFLKFENRGISYQAEWQANDNYACHQICNSSGYFLFPTHNDNKYFCLYFKC